MADVDTSIYSNIKPVQITPPDVMGQMGQAMQLGQMGMQQMAQIQSMKSQMALRQAYQNNVDPTSGQLDQKGVLSDLSKMGMGYMVPQTAQGFSAQNKAKAEADAAQADAAQKFDTVVYPKMKYLAGMSEDDRSRAYPGIMQSISDAGVPMTNVPQANGQFVYDPASFQQHWEAVANSKAAMDFQQAQATVGETRAKTAEAYASAAKSRSETPTGVTGPVGQSTDPSTLVPQMVPQAMRPKALEEIKTAQDIKNITPQIMAAFARGSDRNPNTAAQGQREFEGLINTTVKDTEGTARQAAFDSIHKTMTPSGFTAFPGENDAKKQTVLEYLQSKQSAPTAKAYGIDLSKYDSTSPTPIPNANSDGSVSSTPGSGATGVATANAGTPQQSKGNVNGYTLGAYANKHRKTEAQAAQFLRSAGYTVNGK